MVRNKPYAPYSEVPWLRTNRSILAGDTQTIDRAHRFRKMLGGGMRQAGILAAGALYALDHHIERLRDDHARARRFRDLLTDAPGISFPLPSPTNIVYVEVADAQAVCDCLAAEGVAVFATGLRRIRAVFHLDVSDEDLKWAVDAFRRAVLSS